MKKTVHTEIHLTHDDSIGTSHFNSEREIRIYGKKETLSIEFSIETLPQLQQMIHQLHLIEKSLFEEFQQNVSIEYLNYSSKQDNFPKTVQLPSI